VIGHGRVSDGRADRPIDGVGQQQVVKRQGDLVHDRQSQVVSSRQRQIDIGTGFDIALGQAQWGNPTGDAKVTKTGPDGLLEWEPPRQSTRPLEEKK
jgi:hypothetical protein